MNDPEGDKGEIEATTISNVSNKTNSGKREITTNKMEQTRRPDTQDLLPAGTPPSNFSISVSGITNDRDIESVHTHVCSDNSSF